jgi:hypothetical protein
VSLTWSPRALHGGLPTGRLVAVAGLSGGSHNLGTGGALPMRAIIVDRSAPAALRLADAPEPLPGPSQVLLEVHYAR